MGKVKTILEEANDIVFVRAQEKQREYGPFVESMNKAAKIATELTGKEITTDDFYKCMIALKLSRMAHAPKHDSILDAIAYLASYDNFIRKIHVIDESQLKMPFDEQGI